MKDYFDEEHLQHDYHPRGTAVAGRSPWPIASKHLPDLHDSATEIFTGNETSTFDEAVVDDGGEADGMDVDDEVDENALHTEIMRDMTAQWEASLTLCDSDRLSPMSSDEDMIVRRAPSPVAPSAWSIPMTSDVAVLEQAFGREVERSEWMVRLALQMAFPRLHGGDNGISMGDNDSGDADAEGDDGTLGSHVPLGMLGKLHPGVRPGAIPTITVTPPLAVDDASAAAPAAAAALGHAVHDLVGEGLLGNAGSTSATGFPSLDVNEAELDAMLAALGVGQD
ncbi:hypothetical protein H9P43_001023 [Blastocladiella emersonii ATCC 22665]|nr:hypothetical protein H9P43_001023 [Blastocladiella emersonii ATCC 22665]